MDSNCNLSYRVAFLNDQKECIPFGNEDYFVFKKTVDVDLFLEVFTQYDAIEVEITIWNNEKLVDKVIFDIDQVDCSQ